MKETIKDWIHRRKLIIGPEKTIDNLVNRVSSSAKKTTIRKEEDIKNIILGWMVSEGILLFQESIDDLSGKLIPFSGMTK